MVDDENNVVPLARCEPKIILNKRHPLISVHHINTGPIDKIFDENVLFEIQDEKQVNHTFPAPLSDLGIKRKINGDD